MKWLAIVVGVLLLGFLGYWLIELRDEPAEPTPTADPNQLGEAPEAQTAEAVTPTLSDYELEYGNLAFKYPSEWNLVPGADNDDDFQVITIESPKDNEGYYYCIDFNEYGPGQEADLEASDMSVLSTEALSAAGVGKPLSSVVYSLDTSNVLISALIDSQTEVGATTLEHSITNASGRQLQVFGRFNCREEQLPALTLEQFQNARLFDESLAIYLNLNY